MYVHFPFCRQRCSYCDFAIAVRPQIPHQEYLSALRHELAAKVSLFPERRAVSVYFGGGTPSLWEPACLATALQDIQATFPAPLGIPMEVTLECDPGGVSLDQLLAWRAAGVTRLSIGAQSFSHHHLTALRRQHQPEQIMELVNRARQTGFDRISLDLLIGMTGQTEVELAEDLRQLLVLSPEHVSLYQLTVEPHTLLSVHIRRGQTQAPSPDQQADAFQTVRHTLQAHGYRHYEISNFARARPDDPDYRAVHNRLYWTHGEYLGLGVSAHSFRRLSEGGGERFANHRGPSAYLRTWGRAADRRPFVPSATEPSLSLYEQRAPESLWREALWLALRELDGVRWSQFVALHHVDPRQACAAILARLTERGLVISSPDSLRLSDQGVLFADDVGAAFL